MAAAPDLPGHFSVVQHQTDGRIGIITINRPRSLNALDLPTLADLEAALGALEVDESVRVIVVTGAGDRAFVAGGDIADLNSRTGLRHYLEFAETIHRVFRRFNPAVGPSPRRPSHRVRGGGRVALEA